MLQQNLENIGQLQRDSTVWFHLSKVPRADNFTETSSTQVRQRPGVEGVGWGLTV